MTPAQHKAFTLIRDRIEASGVCPSYQEIAVALDVRSKSNVSRFVDALVRDGYLVRGVRGTRRSLRLANDNLAHVPTSALMAELERRGVRA